jgi:hypothetical protein
VLLDSHAVFFETSVTDPWNGARKPASPLRGRRVLGALLALVLSPALVAAAESPPGEPAPLPPPPASPALRELVIVLRPPEIDETLRIVLARVSGELAAARFQVRLGTLDREVDPGQQVDAAVTETGALAALAIQGGNDSLAIWVFDRVGQVATIQRMPLRQNDVARDAQVLALQAIELIRVSIINTWSPPAPPPPAPVEPEPAPVAAPVGRRAPVSLGLGVASLWDRGMPGPQWMASLNAALGLGRGLAAYVRLAGLGPSLTVERTDGTASIDRQVGALGMSWVFWTHARWDLYVALAVGAEHVQAQGMTSDPTRGAHSGNGWLPFVLGGVGGTARLGQHLSLVAEVDGVAALSRLDVRIGDIRTQPFSLPGILGDVGLRATF